MKLKTTKTLADLLNKNSKYTITQTKLTTRQFQFYVDFDTYLHEIDYDINTNTFKVFTVTYPQNYFSSPKYITTADLIKIYNKLSTKSLTAFIEAFNDFIEV